MCELFAMSAQTPTRVGPYLACLKPRGGLTGPHADGWGVAYYEDRASRIFKDCAPAAESIYLSLLADLGFQSSMVLAHIRKANPSIFGRATANTHPFEREWQGRSWVFAHNGKLPGFKEMHASATGRFRPLGDTDSELAFCRLMEVVAQATMDRFFLPTAELVQILRPVIDEIATMGEFNFILGDGEHLLAHAHTSLYKLVKTEIVDGKQQYITLLATQPLSTEAWIALPPNSLHVFAHGREITEPDASADVGKSRVEILTHAYA